MRTIGVVGFTLLLTTLSACGGALLEQTLFMHLANGILLTVQFDGGFVYSKKDPQILVGTVDTANHPLKVRQITGTGLGGRDLDVAGGRLLRMLPNGEEVLEALPGLPGYDKTQVGCNDKDQLPAWRNNMLFMPSLQEAAKVMAGSTAVKREIPYDGHIVLTGGGALYIRRLGGCVVLKDANSVEVPNSKKSMASGIGGLAYTWVIPAATMVQLQRRLGSSVDKYDLKPTDGEITLHVSSTFGTGPKPSPGEIKHYPHFRPVFDNYVATKQPKLYWVREYFTSPGVDCPPAGDWP